MSPSRAGSSQSSSWRIFSSSSGSSQLGSDSSLLKGNWWKLFLRPILGSVEYVLSEKSTLKFVQKCNAKFWSTSPHIPIRSGGLAVCLGVAALVGIFFKPRLKMRQRQAQIRTSPRSQHSTVGIFEHWLGCTLIRIVIRIGILGSLNQAVDQFFFNEDNQKFLSSINTMSTRVTSLEQLSVAEFRGEYSRLRNKHRGTLIKSWIFFQGLRPY